MTPHAPHRQLERLIDRLVDGELDADARRTILRQLDSEPGGQGWRRCALAFLEAQAWRESLRPAVAAAVAPPAPSPAAVLLPPAPRRLGRVRPLALAASLFLAFAVGWGVRGPGRPETLVATAPSPTPALASAPPSPPAPPVAVAEANVDAEPEAPTTPPADDPLARLLEAWQRQGYAVDQRERTASIRLADGRHVTLPVREFRLTYEGERMY